jgi:ABC-type glycerol-3-phosphate transport system permease component
MAAATTTVLPVIALFLLLQRAFVRGVALTGIKG